MSESEYLINMMSNNELHGSVSYLLADGWKVALPFEYFVYSIFIGTMIKVVLQYFLRKYLKSEVNFLLWIPSTILTLPSFLLLYGLFSYKPLYVYVILPLIAGMGLFIAETFLQKGINEFGWTRKQIV